jgi:hypothetical protein
LRYSHVCCSPCLRCAFQEFDQSSVLFTVARPRHIPFCTSRVPLRPHLTAAACAAYEDDEHSGKIIHIYISDMCPDKNFWCQMDPGHIDISSDFLSSEGLRDNWNGRKIKWAFIKGCPSGCACAAYVVSGRTSVACSRRCGCLAFPQWCACGVASAARTRGCKRPCHSLTTC